MFVNVMEESLFTLPVPAHSDVWGILEAADQKLDSAIGMVNTVRRALEKDSEEYLLSTLDVAGDFIGTAREGVSRAMGMSSFGAGGRSR